jgi:hypothetical protein
MYSIVFKEAKSTNENLLGHVSLSPSNMGLGVECFLANIFSLQLMQQSMFDHSNICIEDRIMLPPCSLEH